MGNEVGVPGCKNQQVCLFESARYDMTLVYM
jgi:hypothetical protein